MSHLSGISGFFYPKGMKKPICAYDVDKYMYDEIKNI